MRGGGGDGLPVPDAGAGGLPRPRALLPRAAPQVRAADPRAGPQGIRGGPGQDQDAGQYVSRSGYSYYPTVTRRVKNTSASRPLKRKFKRNFYYDAFDALEAVGPKRPQDVVGLTAEMRRGEGESWGGYWTIKKVARAAHYVMQPSFPNESLAATWI